MVQIKQDSGSCNSHARLAGFNYSLGYIIRCPVKSHMVDFILDQLNQVELVNKFDADY